MQTKWAVAGLIGIALLGIGILPGCANHAEVLTHSSGTVRPVETGAAGLPLPQIAWGPTGQLLIVQFGSSSCPPTPSTVSVENAHRVIIRTAADNDGPCTADLAPTVSAVPAPAGLDDTVDAQARIDGVEVVLTHR